MRPFNNNYLNVDSKDTVDKHNHPRAMYKWSNKENQEDDQPNSWCFTWILSTMG